jgi:hypothetical protein
LIVFFYSNILERIKEDKEILSVEELVDRYEYVLTTGLPIIFQGVILYIEYLLRIGYFTGY